jgi:hypothetical protein
MPRTIVSNNIDVPETRDAVSDAVLAGIGERRGEWNIVIYQAPDYPVLAVRIEGPNRLRWSWTFHEHEQTPAFVQQRVEQGLLDRLALQGSL